MKTADEVLFHPSSLSKIMPDSTEKTSVEIKQELESKLDATIAKYDSCKNKETKTAIATREKIFDLEAQIANHVVIENELPKLSKGCMTYLTEVYANEVLGRNSKDVNTIEMRNGTLQEEASITRYSKKHNRFFKNNKKRIKNKYVSAEYDIDWLNKQQVITKITDIKTPFTLEAHLKNLIVEKMVYYWQGVGYLIAVPSAQEYVVAYVLSNNHPSIIQEKLIKESYRWKDGDTPNWREIEIIKNSVFDFETFKQTVKDRGCLPYDDKAREMYNSFVEVPEELRIIEISYTREEMAADIEKAKKRILDCRTVLKHVFKLK